MHYADCLATQGEELLALINSGLLRCRQFVFEVRRVRRALLASLGRALGGRGGSSPVAGTERRNDKTGSSYCGRPSVRGALHFAKVVRVTWAGDEGVLQAVSCERMPSAGQSCSCRGGWHRNGTEDRADEGQTRRGGKAIVN